MLLLLVTENTDKDGADEDKECVFSNLNQNQLLNESCASVFMQGVHTHVGDVSNEVLTQSTPFEHIMNEKFLLL